MYIPSQKRVNSIVSMLTKLMKGKAVRKHSLHEKTAASALLKLFIGGNEKCHTTDAPLAHEQNSIFKYRQHTFHYL